jgi:hypothetical protein
MTGLLERVQGLRDDPASAAADTNAVFRHEGDVWAIAWEGRTFRLRDVKGLGYIATLLATPGREVHVLELQSAVGVGPADGRARLTDGELVTTRGAGSAPLLDEQAKAEYRARLDDLAEELQGARDWGDAERAAALEEEVDALTEELARAVGLGGRNRTFSSPAERARINVTKAIRTAIRLVSDHDPALASHLDASVQTGRFCSYAPPGAAPPRWSF